MPKCKCGHEADDEHGRLRAPGGHYAECTIDGCDCINYEHDGEPEPD